MADDQRSSMLLTLLRRHSARRVLDRSGEDMGFADHLPFPFMALVGQVEMRTALILSVINPHIGGVLLVGPRGIGKTTAARGLSDLLPNVERSTCQFGCMPQDYEAQGEFGVCGECAEKLANDEPITRTESASMIELPLNAELGDVVGGINDRIAVERNEVRLDRGILARADQNILYIDEVNLLPNTIVDSILDAAAQGHYTVRRGPMRATYRANFILIGSMNPEEGRLRPQILDRFGLRVVVTGLEEPEKRAEIYRRVRQFRENRRAFIEAYWDETTYAREDVINARQMLSDVTLTEDALNLGLQLVQQLDIHSHRAEFTMFEAARAHAAADLREEATADDVVAVAPMALRMRGSEYIDTFIDRQHEEDKHITDLLNELGP